MQRGVMSGHHFVFERRNQPSNFYIDYSFLKGVSGIRAGCTGMNQRGLDSRVETNLVSWKNNVMNAVSNTNLKAKHSSASMNSKKVWILVRIKHLMCGV